MATPSQFFLINKIIFKPKSSFAIEWETHWAEMRGPQYFFSYEFNHVRPPMGSVTSNVWDFVWYQMHIVGYESQKANTPKSMLVHNWDGFNSNEA